MFKAKGKDYKPKKNENVMWSRIDNEILIFYPEEYVIAKLDPVSAFIWEQIDGLNSIDSIILSLCSKFKLNSSIAENDLNEIIDKMGKINILSENL
jgi:hypothetical protein